MRTTPGNRRARSLGGRSAFGVLGSMALIGGFVASGAGPARAAARPAGRAVLAAAVAPALPPHRALHKPAHAGRVAAARLSARPHVISPASVSHTFVVDTGADTNPGNPTVACATGNAALCSLRAAIAAANADTGKVDAVSIPTGMSITLTLGPLDLVNSMLIDGTGAVIHGGGNQIFDEDTAGTADQIVGVELTGGSATSGGAVDLASGSLVLSKVDVTGNTATYGGGVYNGDGSLWVDGSAFTDNTATDDGGALYFDGGAQQVENSTIGGSLAADANTAPAGAGIYNGGTATISDSTVEYNTSGVATYGAGVGIYNDEVMDLANVTIDHNRATAGGYGAGLIDENLLDASDLTVDDNSISGAGSAYGAGIYLNGYEENLANVTVDGSSNAVTANHSIYGGAVYADDYTFTWQGGGIADTTNGDAPASSDYTNGGALYVDSDNGLISGLSISATSTDAGTADVDGGAFYDDDYATLENTSVTQTSSTGAEVEGGVSYNGYYSALSNDQFTSTVAHGSSTGGGNVDGGVIYNTKYLTISNLTATDTTDTADLATATTPSATASYVEGGDLYTDDYVTADKVSFAQTTVRASGGAGYVDGGGIDNEESDVFNNTEVTGLTVTADHYVDGGLLLNYDDLVATNFTLGNATVSVLGGADSTSPYADGSILYTDDPINITNGTLANVTASVGGGGRYNYGIEVDNSSGNQLTNTTIANDAIAGPAGATNLLRLDAGESLSLLNTIVASSTPSLNCSIGSAAALTSVANDLDNGASCGFSHPGDLQNANPDTAALADNGGAVETAALEAGSPAIEAGTNAGCPTTDARGIARPAGTTCDIGSYTYIAPVTPPPPPTTISSLTGGQSLTSGRQLTSRGGGYRLVMQSADGNLVLYNAADTWLWQSGTVGHAGARLVMQATDGNLVLYSAADKALWQSHTVGHAGDRLVLQSDGNLVVYTAANRVLWQSRTNGGKRH